MRLRRDVDKSCRWMSTLEAALPRALFLMLLCAVSLLSSSGIAEEAGLEYARPSHLATRTLLLDAGRAGDRIVAVGQWGHVVLSDDGGKSWRQAKSVPTRMNLTSVFFVSATEGWAGGHDHIILHTVDGGETWELQYSDPEEETPILSLWFEDARHGIASGAFGLLVETKDGGKTWTRRSVQSGAQAEGQEEGEEVHLNHIFEGPEQKLFIAAEMGVVYRSDDRGATWTRLDPPYIGSFWGGLTQRDGAVLVFGMRGHIFRTPDLGETWSEIKTDSDDNQSLSDGLQLADGRIVLVGLGGSIVIGGEATNQFSVTNLEHRRGISSLAVGSDGSILLFGEFGVQTCAVGSTPPCR